MDTDILIAISGLVPALLFYLMFTAGLEDE